ncbi:MAG: hypothetical protein QF744_16805, partial [SAR202 cluster bacterium]|nr:hypothetical protein [SAR202 cluster bacterium]
SGSFTSELAGLASDCGYGDSEYEIGISTFAATNFCSSTSKVTRTPVFKGILFGAVNDAVP